MKRDAAQAREVTSDDVRRDNAIVRRDLKLYAPGRRELMTRSRYYGRFISYYNEHNAADGSWGDCFSGDEYSVFAEIGCFTIDMYVQRCRAVVAAGQLSEKRRVLLAEKAVAVLVIIDKWYTGLRAINTPVAREAARCLYSLIAQQTGVRVNDALELAGNNEIVRQRLAHLAGPWSREPAAAKADGERLCRLALSLQVFCTTAKAALQNAEAASLARNDHSPETGLFLTFVELLDDIKGSINAIPLQYVRYYYERILHFEHGTAAGDRMFVCMAPGTAVESAIEVESATAFIAEHEGRRYRYLSENALTVKNCEVGALYTLLFQNDPCIEPEKSLGLCTGIRLAMHEKSDMGYPDRCFPLFGAGVNGKDVRVSAQAAPCGFALASKILFMAEGERTVTLRCSLTEENGVSAGTAEGASFTNALAGLGKVLPDEEFVNVCTSLFTISLTGEKGWYPVERYTCHFEAEDHGTGLTIAFTIPHLAGSVTGHDPLVHGNDFATVLPVCRLMLNHDAQIEPYSLLDTYRLKNVRIDVRVRGAADIALSNQFGKLDPATPFMPFGPVPVPGDYLIIGHPEMSFKSIGRVDIDLEWAGVPSGEKGFADYYHGYAFRFDNNCFTAGLSELHNGKWVPCGDARQRVIRLFDTDERIEKNREAGTGRVSSERHLEGIIPAHLSGSTEFTATDNMEYTCTATRGFLRLMLETPQCGFGHELHTAGAAQQLLQLIRGKKNVTLPKQPFVPVIRRLLLNYEAHSFLDFPETGTAKVNMAASEALFHVHPLGIERCYPGGAAGRLTLIPHPDRPSEREKRDGNLFIGLKGSAIEGRLSLFFRMAEETFSLNPARVYWYSLRHNQWEPLESGRLLADTTHGLTTTGIVTFDLPHADIDKQEVMPAGMYWLRAAVECGTGEFGSVCTVSTNGVLLKKDAAECGGEGVAVRLPDGCIRSTEVSVAGIGTVLQMGPSFGGSDQEDDDRYVTRVGERMRHKNRVVSGYDYERLIIEAFPEINMVKCFPCAKAQECSGRYPGHVLMVVVADAAPGNLLHDRPRVNIARLREIREYIRKKASPWAEIDVVNPVYEEIQVRCTVIPHPDCGGSLVVSELEQLLSEYIIPWMPPGNRSTFGWKLALHDVRQYLLSLPRVRYVTGFSMLHKSNTGMRRYSLFDSADHHSDTPAVPDCIAPESPWGICIPFTRHVLNIKYTLHDEEPSVAGINRAEVGNVLIVKGARNNGKADPGNP